MIKQQTFDLSRDCNFYDVIDSGPFPIRFPNKPDLTQDQEWCEVFIEGDWRRVRFHDYAEVFEIPGLYETIFYRTLRCVSPSQVTSLISEVLRERGQSPEDLRVLDLGAGNGMVGEALHSLGSRHIIGVDILPQARMAARRDRPWVYSDYFTCDLTRLESSVQKALENSRFNLLTAVAALGFGDIPPQAFMQAFDFVEPGGWIAFNIKEDFLTAGSRNGFYNLLKQMLESGQIRIELYKRYRHRLDVMARPLYYSAFVAQKRDGSSLC